MLIKKIPNVGALVITAVFNTKIGEVKNKIPDVSGFVKETVYGTKISDIEKEHCTTSKTKIFWFKHKI